MSILAPLIHDVDHYGRHAEAPGRHTVRDLLHRQERAINDADQLARETDAAATGPIPVVV